MKLSTDINCFFGKYSINETIDIIADAGFDAIDFKFMDSRYNHCRENGRMPF